MKWPKGVVVRPSLLFVVTTVVLVYRVALIIAMLAMGIAHVNKYTYWNYFLQTLFYFVLWLSMLSRYPYLFKMLTLFAFPVVFGSVFFVQFFIEVVLQLDGGDQFISATTLDGGDASVGTVHTFDFLVHTCPVIDLFIVLVSGYLFELRAIVRAVQDELDKRGERLILFLYVVVVPLLPLAIYCTIFNPFKEYSTDASPVVVFFVALAIYVVCVWWLWKLLTCEFTGHFNESPLDGISSSLSSSSTQQSPSLISYAIASQPLPQPQKIAVRTYDYRDNPRRWSSATSSSDSE